jgi:hypothetical protein
MCWFSESGCFDGSIGEASPGWRTELRQQDAGQGRSAALGPSPSQVG